MKLVKIIGVVATILGVVATLADKWVGEKTLDNKIAEKVAEALNQG